MSPGPVHQCRGGPHTGTGWGLRVCHQPPEHLDGLKHACVQLSVYGLPALGGPMAVTQVASLW
jgi:hypothetical protein